MIGQRSARTGGLGVLWFGTYAALGVAVGLIVVALELIGIELLLGWVLDAPGVVQAIVPSVGIGLALLILHYGGRTSSSTADAFVQSFHSDKPLGIRSVLPKMGAAIATIGGGGAAGMEGPAVYAGSTLGQWFGRRGKTGVGDRSSRVLLVAGAAAGVAAVFKAPATGVLFALEVPYRRDIAHYALIPALVASAASYVTFVFILGGDRLLTIGAAEVSLTDEVFGALVLGVLGGLTARAMAWLFHWAKEQPEAYSHRVRLPIAGLVLAACVALASAIVEAPATLGPGAEMTIEVVLDTSLPLAAIIGLFALRALATSATLAAGGVGGVFIPLVVQGLLLGRIVESVFDAPSNGLYPVVGLAAVLGAGYRTPLAAVMFVAETTGRAEFVIPALLATAVSQALMGNVSVSTGQVGERQGQLEQQFGRRASEVAITVDVVAPSDSLLDVVDKIDSFVQSPAVPVVDDGYLGLLILHDVAAALMEHGLDATVGDIFLDVPAIDAERPAVDAARMMNDNNLAAVAVTDSDGQVVGMITATSLAGLRDLSEHTSDGAKAGRLHS